MGQLFWVFSKLQTPRRRRGATCKCKCWKFEFPEIAQNHDCRGSLVSSGSLVHKDTFLNFKSDENYGVRPLKLGAKNGPNLPITSPNLNIFQ